MRLSRLLLGTAIILLGTRPVEAAQPNARLGLETGAIWYYPSQSEAPYIDIPLQLGLGLATGFVLNPKRVFFDFGIAEALRLGISAGMQGWGYNSLDKFVFWPDYGLRLELSPNNGAVWLAAAAGVSEYLTTGRRRAMGYPSSFVRASVGMAFPVAKDLHMRPYLEYELTRYPIADYNQVVLVAGFGFAFGL